MFHGLSRFLLSVALVFVAVGCGSSGDRPELGNVSGTVTLDGEPLVGVLVLFGPENGRTSTAMTDEQGHYTLQYLADVQGAKIGPHKVVIKTYLEDESDPEAIAAFVEKVPAKYNTNTELTAEVKEGDNTINFDLTSN